MCAMTMRMCVREYVFVYACILGVRVYMYTRQAGIARLRAARERPGVLQAADQDMRTPPEPDVWSRVQWQKCGAGCAKGL